MNWLIEQDLFINRIRRKQKSEITRQFPLTSKTQASPW